MDTSPLSSRSPDQAARSPAVEEPGLGPVAVGPDSAPPIRSVLPNDPATTADLQPFVANPLELLTRRARDDGDFVRLRLGEANTILVSHPSYVEHVLATHPGDFVKSSAYRTMRRLVGEGMLASDGDLWRRQRALASPAFHRTSVTAYGTTVVEYGQALVARWRDGETRDVRADMMHVTLRIIGQTFFGADLRDEVEDLGTALGVALAQLDARLVSALLAAPLSPEAPGEGAFRRAVARLEEAATRLIAVRRASGSQHHDLLALLLDGRYEDGSGVPESRVRDEVRTLLWAGHDNSSLALTWTWYHLAQHPQVEALLHAELQEVLRGRPPTAEDVSRLPYTEMVVNEAMRLHPPIWLISREAVRDTLVGQHPVEAGTTVLMSQWVIHRDPRFYQDPVRFRPERRGKTAARLPRYAFFPFGGGSHACIGGSFAMLELVLLVATIAQRFRLSLESDEPLGVVPTQIGVLRPRQAVRMVVHTRS